MSQQRETEEGKKHSWQSHGHLEGTEQRDRGVKRRTYKPGGDYWWKKKLV